jgi:hypothetical protein
VKTLTALALVLAGSTAHAQGVTLVMRDTVNGTATTNQMYMDPTHVRVETQTNNERMAFVYDGPAKVIRIVNYTRKSYQEIDQAQMQGMGTQLNAAMAKMQEQMKNLPPEQRKMMEDMMKGRGGMPGMPGAGAPAAPPTYKHVGADRVGQWSCAKYEGYRGAEKVSEICAVDPKAVDLTPADFAAVKQLSEFMATLIPQAAEQMAVNGTMAEHGFNGLPIRRVSLTNGQPVFTSELESVRRGAIPASSFLAPDGFRREAGPGR